MKEIANGIRYIGVDDLDLDLFESQYIVPEGMSYNSFVILDSKVTVMVVPTNEELAIARQTLAIL